MNIFLNIILFIMYIVIYLEILIILLNIYVHIDYLTWKLTKFRIIILISYFLILIYLFYIGFNRIGIQRNINDILYMFYGKILYILLEYDILYILWFILIITSIIT